MTISDEKHDDLLPGIPLTLTDKVQKFFYQPQKYLAPDMFGNEVHLFMHCHLKSYDRTGEGIHMDNDFIDKFGMPNKLEHFWMEAYHAMDRKLARHMFSVGHGQIPFPPVAGYAGMYLKRKCFRIFR